MTDKVTPESVRAEEELRSSYKRRRRSRAVALLVTGAAAFVLMGCRNYRSVPKEDEEENEQTGHAGGTHFIPYGGLGRTAGSGNAGVQSGAEGASRSGSSATGGYRGGFGGTGRSMSGLG